MTRKEKEVQIRVKVEEALNRPLGIYGVHARDTLVKLVVTELEAAGQQWDPEEPEEMQLGAFESYESGFHGWRIGLSRVAVINPFTEAQAREVIRRYEALPRIEEAFRRWQAAEYGDRFEDDFFVDVVEGVLGKDGGA